MQDVAAAGAAAAAAGAAGAPPEAPPGAPSSLRRWSERDVHARRGSSTGPLLKDELKSLRQLGFVDGAVLWLGRGPPCLPHEFLVEFVAYHPAGVWGLYQTR